MTRALLFGSTGALGNGILDTFHDEGWSVVTADRQFSGKEGSLRWPQEESSLRTSLDPVDAVVFAQGMNANGSLFQESDERFLELFDANCHFILRAVRTLVNAERINKGGRIVVLTSLMELTTRQEKLAYTVSKAAAGGLVRSLAVDLAPLNILVNALRPGFIDTPMAQQLLGPEKVAKLSAETPSGHLASVSDVGRAAVWLCSPLMSGITGQTVAVDNGYTTGRII